MKIKLDKRTYHLGLKNEVWIWDYGEYSYSIRGNQVWLIPNYLRKAILITLAPNEKNHL